MLGIRFLGLPILGHDVPQTEQLKMLEVGFLTVLRLEVYNQVLAGPEGSKEGRFFASSQSWWLSVVLGSQLHQFHLLPLVVTRPSCGYSGVSSFLLRTPVVLDSGPPNPITWLLTSAKTLFPTKVMFWVDVNLRRTFFVKKLA